MRRSRDTGDTGGGRDEYQREDDGVAHQRCDTTTQVNAAHCINKPVPARAHSGTFPGVTTCASAFMIVGAGLAFPAGMSEFTMTTITAFLPGR